MCGRESGGGLGDLGNHFGPIILSGLVVCVCVDIFLSVLSLLHVELTLESFDFLSFLFQKYDPDEVRDCFNFFDFFSACRK